MDAPFIRWLAAHVAEVAAAITGCVGVEDLLVEARQRNTDPVMGMALWCEVGHHHKPGATAAFTPHETDHGMTVVIAINPLESELVEVVAPEGRLSFVQRVEVIHQQLDALVGFVIQQIPLQISPDIPFSALAEFHPHEDGFLAGVGPHVGEQCSGVGVFLPVVTWHLVEKMALAMHHFVVAERQHEVFGVGVPDREGDVVLVELTEPGIQLEVIEHVVHPTHVPFQVEAQATDLRGLGHHRPGGGFFRDRQRPGEVLEQHMIRLLQELDGFRVLSAAMLVGQPFTIWTQIVPIQH